MTKTNQYKIRVTFTAYMYRRAPTAKQAQEELIEYLGKGNLNDITSVIAFTSAIVEEAKEVDND